MSLNSIFEKLWIDYTTQNPEAKKVYDLFANEGEIEKLIEPNEVALVVVGLPVNLAGKDSPQTKRTRRFISKLRKKLSVKVIPWDERLSTSEADRALRDMEVKPSKRKDRRDVIAAQLILQGYLDQQSTRLEPRA